MGKLKKKKNFLIIFDIFLLKCIKTFKKYLINKGLFRYCLLLKIENTVTK